MERPTTATLSRRPLLTLGLLSAALGGCAGPGALPPPMAVVMPSQVVVLQAAPRVWVDGEWWRSPMGPGIVALGFAAEGLFGAARVPTTEANAALARDLQAGLAGTEAVAEDAASAFDRGIHDGAARQQAEPVLLVEFRPRLVRDARVLVMQARVTRLSRGSTVESRSRDTRYLLALSGPVGAAPGLDALDRWRADDFALLRAEASRLSLDLAMLFRSVFVAPVPLAAGQLPEVVLDTPVVEVVSGTGPFERDVTFRVPAGPSGRLLRQVGDRTHALVAVPHEGGDWIWMSVPARRAAGAGRQAIDPR